MFPLYLTAEPRTRRGRSFAREPNRGSDNIIFNEKEQAALAPPFPAQGLPGHRAPERTAPPPLVEAIGLEPTTSGLQSRRSPS